MIEKFFTQEKVCKRMANGLMGPYLPSLAAELHQSGHSTDSIRRLLRAADGFGCWLAEQRLSVGDANSTSLNRYLNEIGLVFYPSTPRGRRPKNVVGLFQLIKVLRQQGVVEDNDSPEGVTGSDRWLSAFDQYLDTVVGNAASTRQNYLLYARRFLELQFGSAEPDWSTIQANHIAEFVQAQSAKMHISARRQPVTAIRSLLRFLSAQGVVRAGLEGAVPSIRQWRHASLPRHISTTDVARVLSVCDTSNIGGLRDHAILMFLAHLGLRPGEIMHMRLDDIDWTEGRLLIRAGKTHRERYLPLTHEVGSALATYLQQGRPKSQHRAVFLQRRPPFGPLQSAKSITVLSQKLLKRADVCVRRPGAQILRHTVATQMVRRGASFKDVADILGHQSLTTTAIYAKLDIESLSQVALPWVGGVQ